jgi:hypothetical protein
LLSADPGSLSFHQRRLTAFALPFMEVSVFVDVLHWEIVHPKLQIIAGISQGFAAVANIIIFIAMYWSLRPARYPDIPRSVFHIMRYKQPPTLCF